MYWFCQISKWIHHRYTCVPHPEYFQNSLWKCSWKKKCETSVYVFAPGNLKVIEQHYGYLKICIQISSVAQSCPTLRDPMDCSMSGLPIHHQLPEFTQTHVPWVRDAIQPSHSLSSPYPSAFNHSQHQGLFKWVISSHQVAKVLELQIQHQSFQRIFKTDFL